MLLEGMRGDFGGFGVGEDVGDDLVRVVNRRGAREVRRSGGTRAEMLYITEREGQQRFLFDCARVEDSLHRVRSTCFDCHTVDDFHARQQPIVLSRVDGWHRR